MFAREAEAVELLDASAFDDRALDANLRDIRFINAFLGWTPFTVRAVAQYARSQRLRAFTLLDVASGSADMPLAIARWAAQAQVNARITASDISPQIVALAQRQIAQANAADVTVERQDALALTYRTGSFDIALCTLALHHFAPERAAALLREMARVARHILVFDAARSRTAYGLCVLMTRVFPMSAMTRHDAPLSVRRAYTAAELRAIAQDAGLRDAHIGGSFPFRLALSARGAA